MEKNMERRRGEARGREKGSEEDRGEKNGGGKGGEEERGDVKGGRIRSVRQVVYVFAEGRWGGAGREPGATTVEMGQGWQRGGRR